MVFDFDTWRSVQFCCRWLSRDPGSLGYHTQGVSAILRVIRLSGVRGRAATARRYAAFSYHYASGAADETRETWLRNQAWCPRFRRGLWLGLSSRIGNREWPTSGCLRVEVRQ